ncbi:cytochrome c553 [Tibeticola sediminis]|jgi:cytochrome c553|uniref:Cytochrome c553 n=1 Tax=Tibeticola sediminis TaxID=1917811 RepID=A0A3N4UJW1_9BURK|nr:MULTISPECIES: c-type cytochrome [Tibeticola]MCI4441148.1 c-type cytochrome [Tibeticola sp.]RPE67631.1 cytochrome c553 [Tibeticola sediminis]
MKTWIAGALALAAGLGVAQAQPADAVQLRSWAAACANCHGTHGVAEKGMESLAGQKQDELLKKLLDFKTGRKPATLMHQIAKGYSDEQLQQLAGYFAALKK